MIWAKVLINMFAAFVELVIIRDLYESFGDKNKKYKFVFYPIAILYFIFSIIATIFIDSSFIMLAVNCVLIVCASAAFRITPIKTIFVLAIFIVTGMTLEMLVGLIISAINGISIEMFQQNIILYLQGVLIVKLSSFFILRSLKIIKFKNLIEKKAGKLFLVVPLATILVLFILSFFIFHTKNTVEMLFVVFSSVLLISANIATFQIYDYTLKQINKTNQVELSAIMLAKEVKNYGEIVELQTEGNKITHDIKHKLFEINECLEHNNPEGKKLLNEMCDILENNKILRYTGIKSLDALLNVKSREMQSKNIKHEINAFILETNNFDSIDLCVIFGNLLDNAIEACERTNQDEKTIFLNLSQQNQYLSIKLENSSNPTDLEFRKTKKSNKIEHGFGLINIKEIVEKYDGQLSMKYFDGIVSTIIMMKNKVIELKTTK